MGSSKVNAVPVVMTVPQLATRKSLEEGSKEGADANVSLLTRTYCSAFSFSHEETSGEPAGAFPLLRAPPICCSDVRTRAQSEMIFVSITSV